MFPGVRMKVLNLQWKFMECTNINHDHFGDEDDSNRQLFWKFPFTWDHKLSNCCEIINVKDGWQIGSLRIDNQWELIDPNLVINNEQPKQWWLWNRINISNTQVTTVLDTLRYEILKVQEPFFWIRPGEQINRNDIMCIQYGLNNDGVSCTNWITGNMGFKSVKCNWWSPMHTLHSDAEVYSYGLTPDHWNTNILFRLMEFDMMELIFKGMNVQYINSDGKDDQITVYAIPIALINDGAEFDEQSNKRGAGNQRDDVYTGIAKNDELRFWKYQQSRHWSWMISQSVN